MLVSGALGRSEMTKIARETGGTARSYYVPQTRLNIGRQVRESAGPKLVSQEEMTMKLKSLAALAAIVGMTTLLAGQAIADGHEAVAAKQKVVYHINYDNPKQQAGALRNIQNHINATGAENLDLKVVLHGNGLSLLLDPGSLERLTKFKHANATEDMTAKIDSLRDQGIQFQVCANTVKGRKVDLANDLYYVEEADIVPSGVAQLAVLQGQGYAYIKP